MKKITVFTPTYNRAELLPRLYDSLCTQTNQDFVWLIVDDGSEDDTQELVEQWKDDDKIEIKYYYQKNAGKMAAHNRGAEKADTELFICVDSDDCLTPNAVETILSHWGKIEHDKNYYGIVAYKGYIGGGALTHLRNERVSDCTLKEAYDIYGMSGDTALIFRTNTLKKHKFPVFEGEKFVPESFLYDQLDREGKLSILRKVVYLAEYQDEGYSASISRNLYQNPKGYFAFIGQRILIDKTVKTKYLDSGRYVAMALAHKKKKIIQEAARPLYAFLAYPLGIVLYYKKYASYCTHDY